MSAAVAQAHAQADAVIAPEVTLIEVAAGAMKNNNYLVVDPVTRQALLVDPAWQRDKLEAALQRAGASLSAIALTHAHFDHVHLAGELSAAHDCPVWMSQREIEASRFDLPRLLAIDETPRTLGALRIEPILAPGHTPGCLCYRIGGHLFAGDVLFIEGCGLCRDEAAAYAMFDSLERLKRELAPDTRIHPGHTYVRAPGVPFAELLRWNMYLQFPDRRSFAAYRLRRGQDPRKLVAFR